MTRFLKITVNDNETDFVEVHPMIPADITPLGVLVTLDEETKVLVDERFILKYAGIIEAMKKSQNKP
jgi:hypothetical protein